MVPAAVCEGRAALNHLICRQDSHKDCTEPSVTIPQGMRIYSSATMLLRDIFRDALASSQRRFCCSGYALGDYSIFASSRTASSGVRAT